VNQIEIHEPTLKDNIIRSKVTVPKKISKYMKTNELYIEYDEEIETDSSILNIPIISEVISLAWLTNTDIIVKNLDKRFKESMDKVRPIYQKMYPESTMDSHLKVDNLIENKIKSDGTAQLFSGGVDSVYTTLTNLELKPRLITIWGVEGQPYPENKDYWHMIIKSNKEFAQKNGLKSNVIKTNIRDIVYDRRVEHDFHKKLKDSYLWMRISCPLVLLGILAPLSINRFNKVLIASGITSNHDHVKYPHSTQPDVDENVAWADLAVTHDGYLPRVRKIMGKLRQYLLENDIILRVCLAQQEKMNCSKCEKCLRTIATLAFAGIDPNKHGFNVDKETFGLIKQALQKQKIIDDALMCNYWIEIQEMIPENLEDDIHGSKEFFKWYKNFEYREKKERSLYNKIYFNIPYEFVPILDKIAKTYGKIKKQI
jgi:hypothetical protein